MKLGGGIVILLLICVLFGGCFAVSKATEDTVTFKVIDIETKQTGSGNDRSDEYQVLTSKGIYKNTDDLFHLKYSSGDLQSKLAESRGKEITCKVNGLRIPVFSTKKNILSCR